MSVNQFSAIFVFYEYIRNMEPWRKRRSQKQYTGEVIDLERKLAAHISNTGKEQIKKRKRAGLSVYYLKNGRVVELKPDKTEVQGKHVESIWITLDSNKRTIVLK